MGLATAAISSARHVTGASQWGTFAQTPIRACRDAEEEQRKTEEQRKIKGRLEEDQREIGGNLAEDQEVLL